MPIATVCPKCNATFRVPMDALRREDGSVQCGECSSFFIALKHAFVFDSPIVQKVAPQTIEIKSKRSWNGFIFVGLALALGALGAAVSHLGLVRNAFSLDYIYAVAPAYKVVGVPLPLYKGIDSFVLGQSNLHKDEDGSIRLSFTLYNRAFVSTEWPKLRVTLLAPGGRTTYEVVTNVEDLLSSRPMGPVAPMSNVSMEFKISAEKATAAATYKLEVLER